MKRSEMITVLRTSVHKHLQDMECCSTDEEVFDHILRDLEKAGIEPPLVHVPWVNGHLYVREPGVFMSSKTGKYGKMERVWEPENETE